MRSRLVVSVAERFTQCHKGLVTMYMGEGWVLSYQCDGDKRLAIARSRTNIRPESLKPHVQIHMRTPEISFLISPSNNKRSSCH
jgi:hypothetical protein